MSKLTFNTATINGATYATADFVYGHGQYQEQGWDAINNTADGVNRRDRITVRGIGRMLIYGNKVAIAHPATVPCLSYTISMSGPSGSNSITRTGVVTNAVYRDSQQATEITFEADPIPPASTT